MKARATCRVVADLMGKTSRQVIIRIIKTIIVKIEVIIYSKEILSKIIQEIGIQQMQKPHMDRQTNLIGEDNNNKTKMTQLLKKTIKVRIIGLQIK